MPSYKLQTWIDFCKKFRIREYGVPLFRTHDGIAAISKVGRGPGRIFLQRSKQMDKLIVAEVRKVIRDHTEKKDRYEGLIYLMYKVRGDLVIPLYVGRSEKYSHRSGKISPNINKIEQNQHKFCQWGYGYTYHIGDLSAVVCEGHPEGKKTLKYKRWAENLFKKYPTSAPKLKSPVYFWIKAWKKGETGIWREYGSTSLNFLEHLIIGVASDLFPQRILK